MVRFGVAKQRHEVYKFKQWRNNYIIHINILCVSFLLVTSISVIYNYPKNSFFSKITFLFQKKVRKLKKKKVKKKVDNIEKKIKQILKTSFFCFV